MHGAGVLDRLGCNDDADGDADTGDDDANDDDADDNAVDGDEHKWKGLMMTTTRPSSLFGSCRLMLFV